MWVIMYYRSLKLHNLKLASKEKYRLMPNVAAAQSWAASKQYRREPLWHHRGGVVAAVARAAQRRAGVSAFRKRSAHAAPSYVASAALRLARGSRLRTYVRACTTLRLRRRLLRCAWWAFYTVEAVLWLFFWIFIQKVLVTNLNFRYVPSSKKSEEKALLLYLWTFKTDISEDPLFFHIFLIFWYRKWRFVSNNFWTKIPQNSRYELFATNCFKGSARVGLLAGVSPTIHWRSD